MLLPLHRFTGFQKFFCRYTTRALSLALSRGLALSCSLLLTKCCMVSLSLCIWNSAKSFRKAAILLFYLPYVCVCVGESGSWYLCSPLHKLMQDSFVCCVLVCFSFFPVSPHVFCVFISLVCLFFMRFLFAFNTSQRKTRNAQRPWEYRIESLSIKGFHRNKDHTRQVQWRPWQGAAPVTIAWINDCS